MEAINVWKMVNQDPTMGKVYWNYSYITSFKWNLDLFSDFLKNPPDGAEHGQKCIKSKTSYHNENQKIKMYNFAFITLEDLFPQKFFKMHFVFCSAAILSGYEGWSL